MPWLAAMAAFPWTAYGVSQAFYYNKSKAENTKDGIKFETALRGTDDYFTDSDDFNCFENFGDEEEVEFEDFGPI